MCIYLLELSELSFREIPRDVREMREMTHLRMYRTKRDPIIVAARCPRDTQIIQILQTNNSK